MGKYDDIIGMEYSGIVGRKRMSLKNRVAQFAPFAALAGHETAIEETARLTTDRRELSPEEEKRLSTRLKYALSMEADTPPTLIFTVFQPDFLKPGGRYVKITGKIKRYDDYAGKILLSDNRSILIGDIADIDGDIFLLS